MVVLVFSGVFDNNFMVNAMETETSKTENEKELVQCGDDWVIFKYKDKTTAKKAGKGKIIKVTARATDGLGKRLYLKSSVSKKVQKKR